MSGPNRALLFEMMVLDIVRDPSLNKPPPESFARFSEIVVSRRLKSPAGALSLLELNIPPPPSDALLPEIVLFSMVKVPWLSIPPPRSAEFFEMVLLAMLKSPAGMYLPYKSKRPPEDNSPPPDDPWFSAMVM